MKSSNSNNIRLTAEVQCYMATLDKVISYYENPIGEIAVLGIINNRIVYRSFKEY